MVSEMQSQQGPPAGSGDGVSELVQQVMTAPTRGSSYLFPSTSSGTPLALTGFAFGLTLLSLIQTNWLDATTMGILVPVAFGLSAIATLSGGLWEFRANNLFGSVWEIIYAGFWLSLGLILSTYAAQITKAAGAVRFREAFGVYLIILAIATFAMMIASYFVAAPAFAAFVVLVMLEFVIGLGYLLGNVDLRKAGGYLGLIDALLAFYVAAVLVINTTAERTLLPLWPYPYRKVPSKVGEAGGNR